MSFQKNACGGEWFETVCQSLTQNGLTRNGALLPGFPDSQTQTNTTGQAGADTLCEAYIFYEDCMSRIRETEQFKDENKKLLDFGVGWGRIVRFFLREFRSDHLYGVDINNDLLEICRSTFRWGHFYNCDAYPPLELEDESIDYIVGYSVFSHLSEEACMSWIKEFSRVLKTGGLLALTTRGRWFLEYCESLKNQETEGYSSHLSKLFDDFVIAKEHYDQGNFLHSNIEGVSGGGPLDSSFYGETFIPEEYAKATYSEYFSRIDFELNPDRTAHPILFLYK